MIKAKINKLTIEILRIHPPPTNLQQDKEIDHIY